MKTRSAVIISTMSMFIFSLAWTQPMGGMREGMPMRPVMKLMEELKLTDEQKKEVQKLHFDLQKQMITQRSKIAGARVDLQQLLKADNPDRAAIEKKITEISQLAGQTGTMLLGQWFAVNKLLNPEQQKTWKKALDFGGMMGGGMGMMGGGMEMRGGFQRGQRPMGQDRMMRGGMMHERMMKFEKKMDDDKE
jgi:Spy/CpxP family protein refolding chaperone